MLGSFFRLNLPSKRPFEKGFCSARGGVIYTVDVDTTDAGPHAAIEQQTKCYPSDLTDEEWARIAPLLPRPARRGRRPMVDLREVLNAIRYMARSAGGWHMLPKDFLPWQTVYW